MEGMGKLGTPQFTLRDTEAIKCEHCGGEVFEEGVMLRRVPALLTGTGKPGVIPVPVFICSKCGHVNSEFIPADLKNDGSKLS